MIIAIHNQNPGTGPEDGYTRYQVGAHWVDATTEPTLADVDAHRNPPKTKAQQIAALLDPYNLQRINIQMVIGMAELRADMVALQTAGATTREADLANSFTRNTAYRVARTLENACLAIEAAP
jgi:hypothetical protein